MTHHLTIRLGSKTDLAAAQTIVECHHYLHQRVHNQARPMVYLIERRDQSGSQFVGLIMVGLPHATRLKGWWGYSGLPTQWQVVDINRIWLDPIIQPGGAFCEPGIVPGFTDRKGVFRPATPTWAIQEVLSRVQVDRVSEWPPVYPDQPYHIRLAISYHDPTYHKGTIYRQGGWVPMYADKDGQPLPGARGGKFGWCWPLPEPSWTWDQIQIRRPRTMRLELA